MTDNGRNPPREPSDHLLVARVSQHDVAAFEQLYDRYARLVYVMAVHMLGAAKAEEIVQEVFLRLWAKADQYDPNRGAFRTWFLAIARHCIVHELSGRNRAGRLTAAGDIDRILADAIDETASVEDEAWRRERGEAARRSLANLPPEQRQVLVLAYFGGLSQSAIADYLKLPLGTVKKRTRLGLNKLRRALADQDVMGYGADAPLRQAMRKRDTDER